MNLLIKSISLILSTVLLIACGGSSSDSNKPKPYSLDGYQGRNVNSDSLAGTWVSVSEQRDLLSGDNEAFEEYYDINKEYFVIDGSGNEFLKTSCTDNNGSIIEMNGDEITVNGNTGLIVNNQYLFTSQEEKPLYSGYDHVTTSSFEMIKISDSTEPFGLLELTGDFWDGLERSVDCFRQGYFYRENFMYDSYVNKEIYAIGLDYASAIKLEQYSGGWADITIDIFGLSFLNDGTSISINSQSNTAHSIDIVGSDGFEGMVMKGNINIQLPIH
ncbi:MAG: hypothetical protein V7785_21525 [Bermanella sp.]